MLTNVSVAPVACSLHVKKSLFWAKSPTLLDSAEISVMAVFSGHTLV